MTNEQVTAAVVAFVLANGATVYGIARWGIARAIAYTHLERDVKELQRLNADLFSKHEAVLKDLKGLSMKIERRTPAFPSTPDKGPVNRE